MSLVDNLVKYKDTSSRKCLLCSKYPSCMRFTTCDSCFSISDDMVEDFLNTYSDYFEKLKISTYEKEKNL